MLQRALQAARSSILGGQGCRRPAGGVCLPRVASGVSEIVNGRRFCAAAAARDASADAGSVGGSRGGSELVRSSKQLRGCRMIQKMIKEIFGHPNVPAEGEVLLPRSSSKNVVVILVPEHKALDRAMLRLSYPTRSAHEDECHDMMMYTAARVRIDSELLPYYPHAFEHLIADPSLKFWDDGHILFGNFSVDDR